VVRLRRLRGRTSKDGGERGMSLLCDDRCLYLCELVLSKAAHG
jgi:hypothetical protein